MSGAPAGEELLERDAYLQEAAELLSAAEGGSGSTLLVLGPAGIGKSALIRAIRDRAHAHGFAVLAARGAELEREFSFGVTRQLLEPALAAASPGERERLFSGAAQLAGQAIGELQADDPSAASPSLDPPFAVLHGLYWLTSNLAEARPLVIAVDDAHWSDTASLRFLVYLAGRLEGLPAVLTVGMRPSEPDTPSKLLSALESEPASRLLRVAPLTRAGTEALVRSMLEAEPAGGFAAACHHATGGIPQLIRELLAALAAEGVEPTPAGAERVAALRADRISASVLARVGRAGPGAVGLARAVAVLDRNAGLGLATELAELSPEEAVAAANMLAGLDVIVPGHALAYVHPIVRAAVYSDMAPSDRSEMHARAARLLAHHDADLESIAAQIVAGLPASDPWAVEQLRAAGDQALARGAPDPAITFFDRALAERPPVADRREILVGLGRAFAMLRDFPTAIRRLSDALELADDPRSRAEIVHVLVELLAVSRAGARAIELLEAALEALPDSERELGLRLESDIDSITSFNLSGKRAAHGRHRRFDDPDDRRLIASAAMAAALYEGTAERAAELALRALDGGRLLRDEGPDSPSHWTAIHALLYSHHLAEAAQAAEAWARAASRRGSLRPYHLASCVRTRALYWAGDLPEAEADARTFIEGMPEAIALGPALLADVLSEQGHLAEAEQALRPGARADEDVPWSFFYPTLLMSRGGNAIRRGDLAVGADSLMAAGAAAGEWGLATPGALQWRPPAAEALASLGRRDEARGLIETELEQCQRFGSPRALGIALRSAGVVEQGDRATELLAEAATVLERSPARLEHARALVELGSALRRSKHATEAREPLRQGLALARACGALPLAEHAHEELTATGARPRKIVRAGPEALTASERRVTRMAAEGMTNKEIAQALFVTVRTVEAHLHHAYQKLEISSRGELAGALAPPS
jgi:DNA-binding CsgD family transcriptional regulator